MPQKPSSPVALAVIGTGLSGLMQAWALIQHGFPVTLIGPVPADTQDDERTTAILMPGIRFMQDMAIWDDIAPSATALVMMELIDDSVHSVFRAPEIREEAFGYNVHNAALKNALVSRLQDNPDVTWHDMTASTLQQSEKQWTITLQDGSTIDAEFVIGAEGRQSPTRQAAGIEIEEKHIDQTALVTILDIEKPHNNTSVEWYFHGGPLTLVPMNGNRLAVVWCNDTKTQQARMRKSHDQLEQELYKLTNGRFGDVFVTAPLQAWPVKPMRAKTLIARNCALIGEAAHILPPIGAQGFNISLHDIMTLTGVLKRIRTMGLGLAHNPVLHRYETIRMPEITMRYRSINALNTMLLSPSSFMHGLRRMALRGIGRSAFIKTHLMQAGMIQKK